MLKTRRRKQKAKNRLAKVTKQAKKLRKQNVKVVSGRATKEGAP